MLWSQIKLTSYDFSDLHITSEFDNRPGTERFLSIFSCVVTYRTGAGRRLYIKTSADARPGTVRCRTVPDRRCKRSAKHRTVPGRFYTCNKEYIYIKIPPNKQVVTKERLRLTLTVMVMKTTLAFKRLQKNSIALVGCRLIILSCSSKIYILYLCFGL